MAGIRAVLINLSPMLRDIVRQSVGSERDMEIVGEFPADDGGEPLRLLAPEVVIVSVDRGDAEDVAARLLETAPRARIVALSPDHRTAFCCEMHRKVIFDISPREMAEFIRGEWETRVGEF